MSGYRPARRREATAPARQAGTTGVRLICPALQGERLRSARGEPSSSGRMLRRSDLFAFRPLRPTAVHRRWLRRTTPTDAVPSHRDGTGWTTIRTVGQCDRCQLAGSSSATARVPQLRSAPMLPVAAFWLCRPRRSYGTVLQGASVRTRRSRWGQPHFCPPKPQMSLVTEQGAEASVGPDCQCRRWMTKDDLKSRMTATSDRVVCYSA